jgi:hypothetical protein
MTASLRPIGAPFVAAAPGGARVRARLRVSAQDEAVLREVGAHLGSLAGRDLATRCAEGRLDAAGRARSRAVRKRALTAACSSRWAGAITRTSEDAWRLAEQNLRAEQASLQARIRRIGARLAVPAGGRDGRTRGYATPAERHAKVLRLRSLQARLARAERRLAAGAVPVVRGGKGLLRRRNNLAAAGLTGDQWRQQWESARLFLTADFTDRRSAVTCPDLRLLINYMSATESARTLADVFRRVGERFRPRQIRFAGSGGIAAGFGCFPAVRAGAGVRGRWPLSVAERHWRRREVVIGRGPWLPCGRCRCG